MPKTATKKKTDKPTTKVVEVKEETKPEPPKQETHVEPKKEESVVSSAEQKKEEPVVPSVEQKPVKEKKVAKKAVKKKSVKKTKDTKKKQLVVPKLSEKKEARHFKLIFDGKVEGRFSGNKPKQAANKAHTSIVKKLEKQGKQFIGIPIEFSLKECTRWNKKKCRKEGDKKIEKIYFYVGKRELLDKEVVVDHVQKQVDEKILKGGKVLKEVCLKDQEKSKCPVTLKDGEVKYYMHDVKVDGSDKPVNLIVKKICVFDPKTKKSTGVFKYAIINEIKYKYNNKVQKAKPKTS